MKVVNTSPSFGKYSRQPIEALHANGFELQSLPAEATLDELKPHLADADALIRAFDDALRTLKNA